MPELVDYEKMFIPVHINKGQGHYYLYMIHLKKKDVEIWDSCPSKEEDYRTRTQKLLLALDYLFVEDPRGINLAFKNFSVVMAKDSPVQPNSYDCGIFVINFMRQSVNQFHSEDERLGLALELLKSDLNIMRKILYHKVARRNYVLKEEDSLTPKCNKRKRTDTCVCSEDVPRVEHMTSDDSTRRNKKEVGLSRLPEESNCLKSPSNTKRGNPKGYMLPTTDLIGEQFQNYTKQIWEWLTNDEVSVIGVWGMGGVGKTKLLKHIQNQLLERDEVDSFDYVIWVTVTEDCSISQLHEVIAKSVELDISAEREEKRIMGKLFEKFKTIEKGVLILDDVWDYIDLNDVGFPISNNRNKLILTTRSFDICQSMNCKQNIIRIKTLEMEAAWDLFKKALGESVKLSEQVEKIARRVAQGCEGLPLAIVTIARSMKDKNQIWEWEHMHESLKNLENGQYDLEKYVFPVLRSSYDHLKNKKLQHCFLYCSLVSTIDVTEGFVMEGLIDGMLSLRAQENEFQSILNKLINNSLLEQGEWLPFKMVHYLVRGMALSIVKGTHMATIDRKFYAIPDMHKKLEKVFLKDHSIPGISNVTSVRCPKLSTFLVRWSQLERIANDFFIYMTSLKVLDLSNNNIMLLPESVSNLECLVTLWLSGCSSLRYVPSLAKLRKLRWLSLNSTRITEVPQGLEMLINLRLLDLRRTPASFTTSVIPKLTNLQSLHLNCMPGSMDVKAKDIIGLTMLENISAHLCDTWNLCECVIGFRDRFPQLFCYKLSLGTGTAPSYHEYSSRAQKVLQFVGINGECSSTALPLLKGVQKLIISDCHQWANCMCRQIHCDSHEHLRIESCCITDCDKLKCLFCLSSHCSICVNVQFVDSLELKNLKGLLVLCHDNKVAAPALPRYPAGLFFHLKDLSIVGCDSMVKLLTQELSTQFKNLKRLKVKHCKSMQEILSVRSGEDDEDDEVSNGYNPSKYRIDLPTLESIYLIDLPELRFLYRGSMFCPLSRLEINGCRNFIRLPDFFPTLQICNISKGWWFTQTCLFGSNKACTTLEDDIDMNIMT